MALRFDVSDLFKTANYFGVLLTNTTLYNASLNLIESEKVNKVMKLKVEVLAAAMRKVQAMDLDEVEKVTDIIYREQPNLLGAVLALHQMGHTPEQIEVLLNILLTIEVALKSVGIQLALVTEQQQHKQLARFTAHLQRFEKLNGAARDAESQKYQATIKEKCLVAYVIGTMKEAGFTRQFGESGKNLILVGNMLINCIDAAKIVKRSSTDVMH